MMISVWRSLVKGRRRSLLKEGKEKGVWEKKGKDIEKL